MESVQAQRRHLLSSETAGRPSITQYVEYAVVRGALGLLSWLPRRWSRALGALCGRAAFLLLKRLRAVGRQNLQLAFPDAPRAATEAILKQEYEQLGHHLAEFSLMSRYTRETAGRLIHYEGLEHYLRASAKGKGVLVLTGHLGAWELSSFFHSLMGYPMGMVIRRLDNPLVDSYVNAIRCLHGNRVLHKDDFARGLISEMKAGRTVGILMDTNMTPPQGTFVPFFGVAACTGSGLARIARKTGAAVLPGFLLEEAGGRYRLHFGRELRVEDTGDGERDAVTNTAHFTAVLEEYIRQYPGQWLWMHRRWKTRPPGEPRIYS